MPALIEHHYESVQRQANLTCPVTVKPTAGNKLMVAATCLNTITAISDDGANATWTLDDTLVSTTGNYLWSRQATATDASSLTTITLTNAVEDGCVNYLEVSGLDTGAVNVTGTTNAGTCTTSNPTAIASVTTTGAVDHFIVVVLGMGAAGVRTIPTAPSWNNSFTLVTSAVAYGISSTHATAQILGTKTQTGAGAVGTETATWTGNANMAGLGLVAAYNLAAVAAAALPDVTMAPMR